MASKLKRRERAAVAAVARHFSGTWEESEGRSGAVIVIGKRRIAVEVATIKRPVAGRTTAPRLRLDKAVVRLVTRLQTALRDSVPDGTTVVVTVTAPIRLGLRTAAALEEKVKARLARPSERVQHKDTIFGNQVRFRFVKNSTRQAPKVIGLVHNPDTDPDMLLDLTQALLRHLAGAADTRSRARSARGRWLIVATEGGISYGRICRQICAQISAAMLFAKIVMVFAGDRVETATG